MRALTGRCFSVISAEGRAHISEYDEICLCQHVGDHLRGKGQAFSRGTQWTLDGIPQGASIYTICLAVGVFTACDSTCNARLSSARLRAAPSEIRRPRGAEPPTAKASSPTTARPLRIRCEKRSVPSR